MAGKALGVLLFALMQVIGVLSFAECPEGSLDEVLVCREGPDCKAPDCRCPSVEAPAKINNIDDVPQFVILSFDDAVTKENYKYYEDLMKLNNHNGCPISMTFFVSHAYTNYSLVHELYRKGQEIAVHSVSHYSDVEDYWRPASYETWVSEIKSMKEILARHASMAPEAIKGFRAPFLEVGGDKMFRALQDLGFEYDCSWSTLHYTNWCGTKPRGAMWPYTLDYPSIQDCQIGRCPEGKYPGLWVAPMVDLQDNRGEPCSMLDTCQSYEDELEEYETAVFSLLKRNFEMNYNNNKAPFGLYSHYSWLLADNSTSRPRRKGYKLFLEWVVQKEDVIVVSMEKVIEWMKNPVPVSKILDCPDTFRSRCLDPLDCTYKNPVPSFLDIDEIIMNTCRRPCPENFPWLENIDGAKPNK
ncbi:chitin deacetylase 8-like [Oratosquilla oratoria]|uniref:chitin deacetylase 8-like n=1 Tax=Oratosquilla oratoria TaxID=337810 RepID=UPI003F775991